MNPVNAGNDPNSRWTRRSVVRAALALAVLCSLEACAPSPPPGPAARATRFIQVGLASWYGQGQAGHRTASGELFDPNAMTAAHPTLPIGAIVRVTNVENGRTVTVRIND